MTDFLEPVLDGMPEPPPRWTRPDHGVRLPLLGLDRMLLAALPHTSDDEESTPELCVIRVEVRDGLITTLASDRYSAIRERRPVSQTCGDFVFHLRAVDANSLRGLLKVALRGVDKDEREYEPVDLTSEDTDDGPGLRVVGPDLDVVFTEGHVGFPSVGTLIDGILSRTDSGPRATWDNVPINPSLLARLVPLQRAGRGQELFLFSAGEPQMEGRKAGPIVVRTRDEEDDVVVVVMPGGSA